LTGRKGNNWGASIVSPGAGLPQRETLNYFDWRDRRVISESGVGGSVAPLTYYERDNDGRTTATDVYDGSSYGISYTNGVPNAPSGPKKGRKKGHEPIKKIYIGS
jgi:hypothetical protein